MDQITVREAGPLDELAAMQLESGAFAALRRVYVPRCAAAVPVADHPSPWSRLIVQYGDAIIGSVRWRIEEDRLHLRALAVADSYRRRGVARSLVTRCAAMARQSGLRIVSAYTVVETGNVPIFERLGFSLVRQQIDNFAVTPDGAPVSEAYLELPAS